MRVIIAGSRTITDYAHVVDGIAGAREEFPELEITEVVSGTADGVDSLGEDWADEHDVPVEAFDPDDDEYAEYPPKVAPLERNKDMANYADALIAVWNQESSGTKHMIDVAAEQGLDIYVHTVGGTTLADF